MLYISTQDYKRLSQVTLKDDLGDDIPGSNNSLLIKKANVNAFQIAYAILKDQEAYKPSRLAEISAEELQYCSTIKMIDSLFVKAHKEYKKQFIQAIQQDYEIYCKQRNLADEVGKSMVTGGVRAVKLVNVPVLKVITAPFLFIGGLFYGLVCADKLTKERLTLESSYNRPQWANLLETQEGQRIEAARDLVDLRIQTLQKNISDLANQNPSLQNLNYEKELQVLNKFRNYLDIDGKIVLLEENTEEANTSQSSTKNEETIIELEPINNKG